MPRARRRKSWRTRSPVFPQLCLRTDRRSAYLGFDYTLEDALIHEGREGDKVLVTESVAGAARFAAGKGRGGTFDDI